MWGGDNINAHTEEIYMAECGSIGGEVTTALNLETEKMAKEMSQYHPYAFQASGPRNVSTPSWRDLINSSWLVYSPLSNFRLISWIKPSPFSVIFLVIMLV